MSLGQFHHQSVIVSIDNEIEGGRAREASAFKSLGAEK